MTIQQFNEFLEQQGPSLYRFCCYLTGNRQEADDLYQETWLKAWEQHTDILTERNPKNFLLGLAMGNWKNRCRKRARRQRIIPSQEYPATNNFTSADNSIPLLEDMILMQEEHRLLHQSILALEEKWRLPLTLYYGQELSVQEVASLMKIPVGTVKSRLNKARNILRKHMEEHGYGIQ